MCFCVCVLCAVIFSIWSLHCSNALAGMLRIPNLVTIGIWLAADVLVEEGWDPCCRWCQHECNGKHRAQRGCLRLARISTEMLTLHFMQMQDPLRTLVAQFTYSMVGIILFSGSPEWSNVSWENMRGPCLMGCQKS